MVRNLSLPLSCVTSSNCFPPAVRNRLWNSTGFFLLFWAVHYFPFFLMSRQLFIHHYLPSHLASALVAGPVFSFILSLVPTPTNITLTLAITTQYTPTTYTKYT